MREKKIIHNRKIADLNTVAVKQVERYLQLKLSNTKKNSTYTIETPYYTNLIGPELTKAMNKAEIQGSLIRKTFDILKKKDKPISSSYGKGSPDEIQAEIDRYIRNSESDHRFVLITTSKMTVWMSLLLAQIGVDCSGFVYNILDEACTHENINDWKGYLNWQDDTQRASRASVSVFNSSSLTTIENIESIQPLDLLVSIGDKKHIGIVVEIGKELFVAESTIPSCQTNGLLIKENTIEVRDRSFWGKQFQSKNLVIKRFPFLNTDDS